MKRPRILLKGVDSTVAHILVERTETALHAVRNVRFGWFPGMINALDRRVLNKLDRQLRLLDDIRVECRMWIHENATVKPKEK